MRVRELAARGPRAAAHSQQSLTSTGATRNQEVAATPPAGQGSQSSASRTPVGETVQDTSVSLRKFSHAQASSGKEETV